VHLNEAIVFLIDFYDLLMSSDLFQDHFSKAALNQFFGYSGQHSSYFERYLYPLEK
jgi:hypothetical protein